MRTTKGGNQFGSPEISVICGNYQQDIERKRLKYLQVKMCSKYKRQRFIFSDKLFLTQNRNE